MSRDKHPANSLVLKYEKSYCIFCDLMNPEKTIIGDKYLLENVHVCQCYKKRYDPKGKAEIELLKYTKLKNIKSEDLDLSHILKNRYDVKCMMCGFELNKENELINRWNMLEKIEEIEVLTYCGCARDIRHVEAFVENEMPKFKNLKELDLRDTWVSYLLTIPSLQYLNLTNTHIKRLGSMPELITLEHSYTKKRPSQTAIAETKDRREWRLSYVENEFNRYSGLLLSMGSMPKLESLYLNDTWLTELQEMPELTTLVAYNNYGLVKLASYPKLDQLHCCASGLTGEVDLSKSPLLDQVNFTMNDITKIKFSSSSFKNLMTLVISKTKIKSITNYSNFRALTMFDCSFTDIEELPVIPNLMHLYANNTKIKEIPKGYVKVNLLLLICNDTSITSLPKMTSLYTLDVSNTKIAHIPDEIYTNLYEINMNNTLVKELPKHFPQNLRKIHCKNTKIKYIISLPIPSDKKIYIGYDDKNMRERDLNIYCNYEVMFSNLVFPNFIHNRIYNNFVKVQQKFKMNRSRKFLKILKLYYSKNILDIIITKTLFNKMFRKMNVCLKCLLNTLRIERARKEQNS